MRYKVVSVAPEWTVKRTSPCCPFYVKSNLQPLDLKVQVVVDKHASSGWILVHAYSAVHSEEALSHTEYFSENQMENITAAID